MACPVKMRKIPENSHALWAGQLQVMRRILHAEDLSVLDR